MINFPTLKVYFLNYTNPFIFQLWNVKHEKQLYLTKTALAQETEKVESQNTACIFANYFYVNIKDTTGLEVEFLQTHQHFNWLSLHTTDLL